MRNVVSSRGRGVLPNYQRVPISRKVLRRRKRVIGDLDRDAASGRPRNFVTSRIALRRQRRAARSYRSDAFSAMRASKASASSTVSRWTRTSGGSYFSLSAPLDCFGHLRPRVSSSVPRPKSTVKPRPPVLNHVRTKDGEALASSYRSHEFAARYGSSRSRASSTS